MSSTPTFLNRVREGDSMLPSVPFASRVPVLTAWACGLLGLAILASGAGTGACPPPIAPGLYAIRGAKIYTLAGPPVENGTVLIRGGKIEAVGRDVAVPADAEVLDAKGLEVYPGLFDALSELGLSEVGAVSATVDTAEIGAYNPQLIAATAVRPASELIPVARANGITHSLSAPGVGHGGGNVVMGA